MMSRRKQAKPRAVFLKHEEVEPEMAADPLQIRDDGESAGEENNKARVLDEFYSSQPLDETSLGASPSNSDTLGTDPSLSWNSETADEDHSLSPSSCATPNSVVTEGNDPEVNFTIGPTESTPYACQFCEKAFPRLSYLKKHEQSHSDQMPFQCDFCQRLFKHKRSRDRHVKLHTGDKKYRCPHCESAFSRSDHLKIHMKTHDHQKPYQCVICNRGYNTAAALTSHMQNHKKESSIHSTPSPGPFRCLQCTGTFLTGEELQTHVSHHHRPISSSTPEKQSSEGGNGKRRSISPKTPSSSPSSRGRTTTTAVELDHTSSTARLMLPFPMPKLTCIYCTKDSFTTMEALQLHVQAMHGALLKEGESPHHLSSPMISPPGIASPENVLPPGSLTCNFCTMKFSCLTSLHKHALSVHSLSGYLQAKAKENAFCAQCAIAFPNSIAYAEHFLIFHAHSSPLQQQHHHPKHTQVCSPEPPQVNPTDLSKKNKGDGGSSSSTSSGGQTPAKKIKREEDHESGVEIRTGSNSSGSVPPSAAGAGVVSSLIPNPTISFGPHSLLCNQCNAGFSDFESFRTHLKNHLEEVVHKFVCDECENEFGTEEQLENHAMAHYLATTTEYGCQSCLKLFGKPDELQKHLMDIHAHHLYRCALCKEMFDSKVSIQVHFAVKHSNECKLFRCTSCTTIFRSEIEFQVHVKMAHLRKLSPYRCLLCSASFGNELDLQFHLSTHQKQFRCKFCDEAFHVEFLLDKHMQTHHTTMMNGGVETQRESPNALAHSISNHPSGNNVSTKSSGKKGNASNGGASGKGKDIKCDICDKSLNSETELSNHRKQVHHIPNANLSTGNNGNSSVSGSGNSSGKGNQKSNNHNSGNHTLSLHCAYCSENCKSRSDLENHMKTHQIVSSGKHKCNICDEVCPTATLLAEHKLTHCKVVSGSVCTGCKQNLSSEEKFYTHMKQHCPGSGGGHPSGNTVQLPMPCIVCRQTLMTDIEIQMHAKFHTKQQQNYDSSVGNTKTSRSPNLRIQCCFCHRFEDKIRFLLNGFTNGAQTQTYVCPDCYKKNSSGSAQTISSPPMLPTSSSNKRSRVTSPENDFRKKTHQQQSNKGNGNGTGNLNKKSYQCIKCQMSFASEEEIQSHVTTHMMNEGSSHECHLCSHVFFDSPMKLQCHLIKHTFEGCSSFTCYMCSAVFTTANGLQQHMVEHGLHTRPYDCTHCHLKFFFRAELENHIVTHEEIKRSILERYAATTTTTVTDFSKCILNLTTQQQETSCSGGRQIKMTSNGHQPRNSSSSSNNNNNSKVNHKRKKFFYRSDDSDEELESHSQSGLSMKTEESESSEKRDLRQRVNNNGGSSVSDDSMDNNEYGRTTTTPQIGLDDKCIMATTTSNNNDQLNGRTDKLNNLDLDRDSS